MMQSISMQILADYEQTPSMRFLCNKCCQGWNGLLDYEKQNVSDTVIRLLLGQNARKEVKGHDEY
jgi:hypothetical protein